MKKIIQGLILSFFSVVSYAQTPCYATMNMDPTNITSNSAVLNWFSNGITPANGVDIYYSTSNTTPTATTVPTINGATGSSRVITSLSPATTYYAWVRSNCSSAISEWSFPKTITTLCSQNLPYFEDFESTGLTSIPVCSTQQSPNMSWSGMSRESGLGFSAGKVLGYYANNISNVNSWWFTYKFNFQAGVRYVVKFKKGNENIKDAVTHRLKLTYGTAPNSASMTNIIKDFTANQTTNAETEIVYFTPTVSGEYHIGFNLYNPAGVTGKGFFFLDDVSISVSNNCLIPENISTGSITQNSAVVSWSAPTSIPAEGYDIYYSTNDAEPTSSTIPNYQGVSGLSQNLSSLVEGKRYFVWVRSRCSSTQFSDWSGTDFYTGCPTVFNIPYVEDFEGSIAGSLPNCTSSTDPKLVVYNNHSYAYTGNNIVKWPTKALHFDTVDNSSVWFFTGGINLESGKQYKITYLAGKGTPMATDMLKVALGTEAKASSMINTLKNGWMSLGRGSEGAVFSVPANGIYYVGFNAYSSNGSIRALGIDDIRIVENGTLAAENVNKEEEVAVYPNPFVDNIYISNVEKVKSIVVNDFSGKQIKVLAPVKEVDLQELNTGVYMISLYYKDGSTKTFKVVKK